MDWSGCANLEVLRGKVSDVPLLKGTRVQADTILECAELGMTPEEIASDYRIEVGDVMELLAYAARQNKPTRVR